MNVWKRQKKIYPKDRFKLRFEEEKNAVNLRGDGLIKQNFNRDQTDWQV